MALTFKWKSCSNVTFCCSRRRQLSVSERTGESGFFFYFFSFIVWQTLTFLTHVFRKSQTAAWRSISGGLAAQTEKLHSSVINTHVEVVSSRSLCLTAFRRTGCCTKWLRDRVNFTTVNVLWMINLNVVSELPVKSCNLEKRTRHSQGRGGKSFYIYYQEMLGIWERASAGWWVGAPGWARPQTTCSLENLKAANTCGEEHKGAALRKVSPLHHVCVTTAVTVATALRELSGVTWWQKRVTEARFRAGIISGFSVEQQRGGGEDFVPSLLDEGGAGISFVVSFRVFPAELELLVSPQRQIYHMCLWWQTFKTEERENSRPVGFADCSAISRAENEPNVWAGGRDTFHSLFTLQS